MAYGKRKNYGTRKTYKRKTYNYKKKPMARGGGGYMKYAKYAVQAFKMGKYALAHLNVEYKNATSTTAYAAVGVTYSSQQMILPIPEGTGESARNGSCIELKNTVLMGQLTRDAADTKVATRVKLVIWQPIVNDYTDRAAEIAPEVYDGTTINALRNLDYTKKYIVHHVRHWTLTDNKPSVDFTINHKYSPNYKYQYLASSTTGGATELESNCMYISVVSDATANEPNINWQTRTLFIDN